MLRNKSQIDVFINRVNYEMYLMFIGILSKIKLIFSIGLRKYCSIRFSKGSDSNKIGLVAIVKNEEAYIREWIEYHKLIGISHFYIYDNESSDDLKHTLSSYIKSGEVTYKYFPGKGMQEKAYLDCVKIAKKEVSWLVTLDIDEFLEPLTNISLKEWLSSLSPDISQVELGWMVYGSGGHIDKPRGLVIENYIKHAKDDFITEYKPIVRPERVIGMTFPHQYKVAGKTIDEQKKRIWSYRRADMKGARPAPRNLFRINHYYSKSLSEFFEKSNRGDASVPDRKPRNLEDFKKHDKNNILDLTMKKYVKKIKENLSNRGSNG
ncbi:MULTISPECIES: glycosyltransferase family 92 protein [Limosilactobacillus]|mgnify:CR=1 FL=1|uniref:Glycosyltransferase family 92 protein n=1 Tax=Limosilactobacillus mucosae TaxID=97478 RepID=A0A508YPH7_LIMMU|nr:MULTISPECIES: glycosyltransferase family 92 protein [Limosilactobacillus]MCC6096395.1 glycosyltransferase family 92 protein [Limosilactobacillus sp.]VTZ91242.1 hypothetical protein LMUP508_01400 [Limosilactobacillus mucosae]